jgi:endonuclease/exonuclease/phosphatase family metal-dependent hydrolase
MRRACQWLLLVVGSSSLFLLLLLFACGYAAAYVPPDATPWAWGLGPLAVLLPAVSLVLGLVAIPIGVHGLVRARRGRAAGAGVLLLLIAVRFGPAALPLQGREAPGKALRVMTFNASSSVDPGTEVTTVLRAIQDASPHVLALQEAVTRTHPRRTTRYAPPIRALLEAGYQLPARMPPVRSVLQSVVSQGVPLDSFHNVVPRPDPPFRGQATASRAWFRWKGRSVALYNVHLHTVSARKPWTDTPLQLSTLKAWMDLDFWRPYIRSYREGARARAQQARTIRNLLRQEDGPTLLMGDFNSTRHHWVYRHIAQGMREAYRQRGPWQGSTYPSRYPVVRIDHVLASRHWTVADADVLGHRTASDHRPVVAVLHLRGGAPSSRASRAGRP